MANENTAIKFYVKNLGATQASTFSTDNVGSIVFDKTAHALFVNGTQYGGNLADATFANNVLTITKADGTTQIQLDFSSLATTSSVMAVFNQIGTELDAIETGAGLGTDGTYTADSTTNYLTQATSLKDADKKLDAQIKSLSDTVSGLTTGVSDVQINSTSIESNGVADIAVDGTYDASDNKIATKSTVEGAITGLTGSATIASSSDGVVTLKAGITETNGKVSNNSGSDITLAKVATTGAAADVSYEGSDVAGSEPATVEGALDDLYDKVNQAIAAAGVTEFGDKTGAITLGSYLGMGTGADDHKVGVTNVDTAGTSTTDTDLATVKTVTTHINALDTQADVQAVAYTAADTTNGAKLVFKGVSETDGVIAQGTGTVELQLAKVATTGTAADLAITDSGDHFTSTNVEGALAEVATKAEAAVSDVKIGTTSIVSNNVATFETEGTYNSSTNKIATESTVSDAIEALDVPSTGTGAITGFGAGKTLATLTETDGKVAATFQDISITTSQISDASTNLVTSVNGDGTYLEPTSATNGDVTVSHKTRTESTSTSTGTVGSDNTGTTDTFTIPTYTFDAAGHETAADTKTITITFPSAADLGLSSAMHFVGTSTTDPTEAGGATVSGHTTWAAGDVVLYGNKEYVYNGTNWVELGDEGSYAQKTVTITAGNCLTGGGDLTANRTISHDTITTPSSGTDTAKSQGNSVTLMSGITGDGYGHVTGYTTNTFTIPIVNDATLTITDGANNSEIFSANESTNATLTVTGSNGISAAVSTGTLTIGHSNSVTAVGTAAALKVAYDAQGHITGSSALTATDVAVTSGTYGGSTSVSTTQAALDSLTTAVNAAAQSGVQSIGGATGAVTVGNGLTSTTGADGSVSTNVTGYIVNNAGTNSNALNIDSTKVDSAYTVANTTNLATVASVTAALDTLDVTEYALGSKDGTTNVITLKGIKEENGKIAIGTTAANDITFAAVAATGSASDVAVTSANYGGSTATTSLQTALNNLATSVAVVDTADSVAVNSGSATTIATVGGHDISTTVNFYWEEYN